MALEIGGKHIDKIAVRNLASPVGDVDEMDWLHVSHFRAWSIYDIQRVVHAHSVETQLFADAEEPFS